MSRSGGLNDMKPEAGQKTTFKMKYLNHQLVRSARDGNDARITVLIDRGANCDAVHDLGDPDGARTFAYADYRDANGMSPPRPWIPPPDPSLY